MKSMMTFAFATVSFLNSVNTGLAQEDCTKCRQNYGYVCTQNFGECMQVCRGIGAIDKNACRRKCFAGDAGCNASADLKCGTCSPEKFAIPPSLRIQ